MLNLRLWDKVPFIGWGGGGGVVVFSKSGNLAAARDVVFPKTAWVVG